MTQELWRFIAALVGGIFFARYLLQMHDFVGEIYGRKCVVDSKKNYLRLVQIFSAKLVLEVFGGKILCSIGFFSIEEQIFILTIAKTFKLLRNRLQAAEQSGDFLKS